jgi:uncharacterized protein
MEMSSSQFVPAPVEATWRALNDPEVLKACIPGCESVEKISDTEYQLVMVARVGPVSAKFKGKMLLSDLNPPDSYTLGFEGQGGATGFAKGRATVNLAPEADGTRLTYSVNAQIGGKLAQVGSRLVDGAAKKMADDFFARFTKKFAAAEEVPQAQPAPASPPTGARRRFTAWQWTLAAIVLVIIIYLITRKAM